MWVHLTNLAASIAELVALAGVGEADLRCHDAAHATLLWEMCPAPRSAQLVTRGRAWPMIADVGNGAALQVKDLVTGGASSGDCAQLSLSAEAAESTGHHIASTLHACSASSSLTHPISSSLTLRSDHL